VNEDALPGTVIKTLQTTDLDTEISPVQFYITGGDPRSEFSIRSTGEVFVSKFLDRESFPKYVLDIVGTDGEHIARTKLSIDILDANGRKNLKKLSQSNNVSLNYRQPALLSEV